MRKLPKIDALTLYFLLPNHVCTAQTQKPTVKHTHVVYLKVDQAKTSSQPTPTPKMD